MSHVTTSKRFAIFCTSLLMIALSGGLVADTTEKQPMHQMKQGTMDKCRAMMQKHQAMMAKSKEADARLQGLVEEMDAARGKAKTRAIAAVVQELVAQRQAMKEMMGMGFDMTQHTMTHMRGGMKQDMMGGMGDCPMMQGMSAAGKGETGEREGHTGHHGG